MVIVNGVIVSDSQCLLGENGCVLCAIYFLIHADKYDRRYILIHY